MSTQAPSRSPDVVRVVDIKLIHIARTALHMGDDDYRALLHGLTGKTSSKALDAAERQKVLARMKQLGFVLKPKAAATGSDAVALIRAAQLRKLRAMWYALATVGEVAVPANAEACGAAVEAWAMKRIPGLQALRFADGKDMGDLIEQMKAWGDRVGADVHQATPSAASMMGAMGAHQG